MSEDLETRVQSCCARIFPGKQDACIKDLVSIASGWEHEMYAFDLEHGPTGERHRDALVLRIYPGDYAEAKSEREFYGMRKLYEAGYPVPYVYALEPAGASFSQPAVIMERIDGRTLGPLMVDVPEANRRQLRTLACELLARLHRLDWRPFADDPGNDQPPGPFAFVDMYLTSEREVLQQYSLTGFLPILEWLAARRGDVACTQPAVVHGDFHPQNILVRDDGSAVVIDWTGLHVSDARVDLGWLLMLSRSHAGTERRDQWLDEYERVSGTRAQEVEWFETLACVWRLRVVVRALAHGPEKSGLRPAARTMIEQHLDALRRVRDFLLQTTGVSVPEVEALLAPAA
jgi:aminoglycoside phosphotransferase (APT) family kinase protein